MLQLHLSYQQCYCLLMCDLYKRFYGRCGAILFVISYSVMSIGTQSKATIVHSFLQWVIGASPDMLSPGTQSDGTLIWLTVIKFTTQKRPQNTNIHQIHMLLFDHAGDIKEFCIYILSMYIWRQLSIRQAFVDTQVQPWKYTSAESSTLGWSCFLVWVELRHSVLGPLLLTWFNFNPSMDK